MRNSFVKKMALALVGTMVIGSLAGCGEKEVVESNPVTSETVEENVVSETEVAEPTLKELDWEDVEFRVAWNGNDVRNNNFLNVIEEFESDYNNLFVTAEFAAWSQYKSRISTQAAGNQLPDVLIMDYSFFKDYDDGGLLLPLNDYIESGALDLSNVGANDIASGTLDGDIVAIPLGSNAPCFAYDPAILEKSSVTMSEAPTLEEFTEVAKAVYDATGAKVYPATGIDLFVRQVGAQFIGDDGKSVGFTAEQAAEYYNWYYEGVEYGYIIDLHNMPTPDVGLADGTYWAAWMWSNNFAPNQAAAGKELGLIPMPTLEGAEPATYLKPTLFWSVAASSENPDLAVEFLNYYFNDKGVWDVVGTECGVPINADAKAYVGRSLEGVDKQVLEFIAWLGDADKVSPIEPPTPAAAAEVKTLFMNIRDKIGLREMKKDDIVSEIDKAIKASNEILSK